MRRARPVYSLHEPRTVLIWMPMLAWLYVGYARRHPRLPFDMVQRVATIIGARTTHSGIVLAATSSALPAGATSSPPDAPAFPRSVRPPNVRIQRNAR